VSGDVNFASWPEDKATLNAVSANVHGAGQGERAPKDVVVQTVSGDFELRFNKAFESLKAESVSGSVQIHVPKDTGMTYKLETVSGDFQGFPGDGKGLVGRSLSGTSGNGAASIKFNSISGDFSLHDVNESAKQP
jgi:DUF4097 and DUF4098 domain-containing protein YvlB